MSKYYPPRLSPYWDQWRCRYKRALVQDGLQLDVAKRFADVIAMARAGAALIYGRSAAEKAELKLEFLDDGSVRGQLVGQYWNYEMGNSRPLFRAFLGARANRVQ